MSKTKSKGKTQKIFWLAAKILIIGGVIFGGGWWIFTRPSAPESEIVSRRGIHWHANLAIKINGEIQEIPENVGMVFQEMSIHTHAKDGVIHMEFPGLVKTKDIRLGKFFEIWSKKFNKDCIFEKCSGSEGKVKMFINGKENLEFENYIMRDGDKIEIIFE